MVTSTRAECWCFPIRYADVIGWKPSFVIEMYRCPNRSAVGILLLIKAVGGDAGGDRTGSGILAPKKGTVGLDDGARIARVVKERKQSETRIHRAH